MSLSLLAGLLSAMLAPAAAFEPSSGTLHAANAAFHSDYNDLLKRTQASLGGPGQPVIVMLDDDLILLRGGTRAVTQVIPPLYHRLKAVSHVPFGLYLALAAAGPGRLAAPAAASLKEQRAGIAAARAELGAQFPPELRARQDRILKAALACADGALKRGVSDALLRSCSRDAAPLLEADASDAARLELKGLDAAIKSLDLSAQEWSRLLVVICASHQPRHREVSYQFFLRLLGEKEGPGAQEEVRVVYAEGIFEEQGALRLLARHLIDRRAAEAFFGEPGRLQRDLLGDAAAVYLDAVSR